MLLVEVYQSAELRPDAGNKGRLLTLLRLFEAGEPTRKKFIGEMIGCVFTFYYFFSKDFISVLSQEIFLEG